MSEPVTLINAFTVPPDEHERFLNRWNDNARVMASQPGLIQARMYRSLVDAQLNFVNVAEWDSQEHLDRAQATPEFRASIQRLLDDPDLHVTPRPVVYQAAIDVRPAETSPQTRPSRGLGNSGRATRIIAATALAATSAFAGGALLTQTVIVPHWRAMDPAAFLSHFATYGPATGATVFPFEVASVLLLGITTYSTVKGHRPGRLAWTLATAAMLGTFLLLPIYFLGANLAMLDPAFPLEAVHSELTAWYRWNWVRAGLGLAAAALACIALTASGGKKTTTPR